MLTEKMEKALNDQLTFELVSAYLYYAMSAYCEANDLAGMANWFKVQAQEEMFHASKFFDYINDRDGRVELGAIEKPAKDWDTPLAAFSAALEHERIVSGRIHDLVELSQQEKDRSTYNFLQWFVGEQVEEEATARNIIGQLKIVGSEGAGLYMVDQQLGTRVFTMPAATAE